MSSQMTRMDLESVPDSSGNKGGEASTSTRCRKEDIQYRQVTVIGLFRHDEIPSLRR